MFDGPLEIDMTKDGFIEFSVKVILLDPYKYSDTEYTSPAYQDQIAVKNDGTAKTYPIIEATALKNSTSFMITKEDKDYFMVGVPEDTSTTPVNNNPVLLRFDGSTVAGWTYIPHGTIVSYSNPASMSQGFLHATNGTVKVREYGSRTDKGWYGPAVKKSLPHSVQDFTVTADMKVFSELRGKGSVGKVLLHLFNESGEVVFSIGLLEESPSSTYVRAWFGFYNQYGEKHEIYDSRGGLDDKGTAFEDNYIHLSMTRRGNRFEVKTWAYWTDARGKRVIGSRMNRTYIDAANFYNQKIAQVGFQLSRHTAYQPSPVTMNNIRFTEHLSTEGVPYIIKAGDVVYIDMNKEIVTIGNDVALEHKDFGSDFFSVDKGVSELFVLPQNTFETTVNWVNRFL